MKLILKELRQEKQLTQMQLAQSLGVSDTAVRKWELGTREPSLEMAISIAKFFGITVGQLIGSEEY